MVRTVVFLRHGESVWNKENLFTGWTDVDLSSRGVEEAHEAARLLKEANLEFDVVYTSVLKRAINTAHLVMQKTDQLYLPMTKAWQLNERMYGTLQGLDKKKTAEQYGDEQVLIWRRSYDVPPPELETSDSRHPSHSKVFSSVPKDKQPNTESLKTCLERVLPYWKDVLSKDIAAGKRVLVVAHGNSIRALVKHLDGVSDEDIVELNIPTGVPLVYELDNKTLAAKKHYYLGDADKVAAAQAAVASQASGSKAKAPAEAPVAMIDLNLRRESNSPKKPAGTTSELATQFQEVLRGDPEPATPGNPSELASAFSQILAGFGPTPSEGLGLEGTPAVVKGTAVIDVDLEGSPVGFSPFGAAQFGGQPFPGQFQGAGLVPPFRQAPSPYTGGMPGYGGNGFGTGYPPHGLYGAGMYGSQMPRQYGHMGGGFGGFH